MGDNVRHGIGSCAIHKTFGPGTYNIQSVFAGTNTYFTSTSAASNLAVSSGPWPTTTTISAIGVAGNYARTGTVWAGGTAVPTGSVSFWTPAPATPGTAGPTERRRDDLGFFTNTTGPSTCSGVRQSRWLISIKTASWITWSPTKSPRPRRSCWATATARLPRTKWHLFGASGSIP